jgi:hypothetical protein
MTDAQLRWLHYNRGEPGHRPAPPFETGRTTRRQVWEAVKRGRTEHAGEAVRRILEDQSRLSACQRRVLQILDDEGGLALLNHVTGTGLRRAVLRIEVSEPAVLYELRLRWEQRLLAALQEKAPELGVQAVRFMAAGQEGKPRSRT